MSEYKKICPICKKEFSEYGIICPECQDDEQRIRSQWEYEE